MSKTTVERTKYGTIITEAGAAKMAAGILNGAKINIVSAAVGDGGGMYYMPTSEQKALVHECWRGEIAYARLGESADNIIDIKFIVPADVGGFTVREAALFDSDGDMIAVCNTPDAEKVPVIDGVSFPLTMVMHIIVKDASAVSFTVNPALDTVSREELEAAIRAHNSDAGAHGGQGGTKIFEIELPSSGWTWDDEENEYRTDVPAEQSKAQYFPDIALHKASAGAAIRAKLCPTALALDGAIRFWAKNIPSENIAATVALLSPGGSGGGQAGGEAYVLPIASATTLGGIKLGAGLNAAADGTVSVKSAVSDEDKATTVDTESMLDDIFSE